MDARWSARRLAGRSGCATLNCHRRGTRCAAWFADQTPPRKTDRLDDRLERTGHGMAGSPVRSVGKAAKLEPHVWRTKIQVNKAQRLPAGQPPLATAGPGRQKILHPD